MRKRSWWMAAGAGAAAVVVTGMPLGAQARYAASELRISRSKEPIVMPSQISRVDVKGNDTTIYFKQPEPLPPFRLADYVGLSEPQITNYMATRDSAQIGLARLAQQRVTNPAVREFAANIERDRTRELAETEEIITDEGVGFEPRQNDYALARMVEVIQSLNKMPSGPEWDLAFLRTQFFLHENDVQVLTANRQNAHDDDLERHMDQGIKDATRTRDGARNLAQALGMTLP